MDALTTLSSLAALRFTIQAPRGDHTYGTCPVHHVADWREITDNNGTWGVCNRCWPPEPAREVASASR